MCNNANPIERLWAVLHQYVTHNRDYPSQKQFADAILAFMRETIPQEWKKFHDKVSDNFRVITHENFRVLEWKRYSVLHLTQDSHRRPDVPYLAHETR